MDKLSNYEFGNVLHELSRLDCDEMRNKSGLITIALADAADRLQADPEPANNPLTLDELRGMDGEPVWVHRLEDNQGWWVVIKSTERDKVTTDYGGYFEFADYGKTWLAYRRKPE